MIWAKKNLFASIRKVHLQHVTEGPMFTQSSLDSFSSSTVKHYYYKLASLSQHCLVYRTGESLD